MDFDSKIDIVEVSIVKLKFFRSSFNLIPTYIFIFKLFSIKWLDECYKEFTASRNSSIVRLNSTSINIITLIRIP